MEAGSRKEEEESIWEALEEEEGERQEQKEEKEQV